MEKKYIANWLPLDVEVEPKVGDMVKTMGEPMRRFEEGMRKDPYRVYKLFLCSRDISYGQKAFSLRNGFYEFGKEENSYSDESVVVLGEISPQAIWVKGGDEFDEKDIRQGGRVRHEVELIVGTETCTYWGDRVILTEDRRGDGREFICTYLDDANLNHHSDCIKGTTYNYGKGVLGFTKEHYYEIRCLTCKTFH